MPRKQKYPAYSKKVLNSVAFQRDSSDTVGGFRLNSLVTDDWNANSLACQILFPLVYSVALCW